MWDSGSFERESFSAGSWLYDLLVRINSIWRTYIVPKESRAIAVERDK